MSAYCIANVQVHTPEVYEDYRQHTLRTLQAYGGEFIVRGGAMEVKEGTWRPGRVVVVRFESMDKAKAWYDSPQYQAILPSRKNGATTDMIFVEGFE